MKSVALNAFARTQSRRAGAKQLRASGRIPAVIYGRQAAPQNLEVNSKEIETLIAHSVSENLLLDLIVKGDARSQRLALLQEVQHHSLSEKILHVDFHEVAPDEKVIVMVSVETEGESIGVKADGGVLEHVLHKVKVSALPRDLPEVVIVDVSEMKIGSVIHLGDIKMPAGAELIGDKHASVISVAAPRAEEVVVAEAAAAPGEVEMIKEKKEDGAEAPAGKPGEKAPAAKAGEKAPAAKAGEKAPAAEKKAEKKK